MQERARALAIVETMDGGKPIRESRDIDIPLAAAHFFHYAGWADKIGYGIAGREHRPHGVVAQIVPWNFPSRRWRPGSSRPRSPAATPRSSSPPTRRR